MQWAYRWRNVGGPTMDVIRFDHVHARILGLIRAFVQKGWSVCPPLKYFLTCTLYCDDGGI